MYTKKVISIIVFFLIVSCNSDDNKDVKTDPIYDSEYIPLKSIDEL